MKAAVTIKTTTLCKPPSRSTKKAKKQQQNAAAFAGAVDGDSDGDGGGGRSISRNYLLLFSLLLISLVGFGSWGGCTIIKKIYSDGGIPLLSTYYAGLITPAVQEDNDYLPIDGRYNVPQHTTSFSRRNIDYLSFASNENKFSTQEDHRNNDDDNDSHHDIMGHSYSTEGQPDLIRSRRSSRIALRRRHRLCPLRSDKIMITHDDDDDNKNKNNIDRDLNIDSRVVGGEEAERLRFTYLVAMFKILEETTRGRRMTLAHRCGGVLVAPNVVMSAAHCNPKVSVVKIGLHSFNDGDNDESRNKNNNNNGTSMLVHVVESFNITKRILHPNFDEFNLDYDVGLYVLNGTSTYNSAKLNDDITEPKLNSDLHVIGWGFTRLGGDTSEVPNVASVRYMSSQECNVKYATPVYPSTRVPQRITDSMMCAARPSRDACQGDSGGPLLMKGNKAEDDVVVGLVSWGYGCADPEFPGVYSRVSSFRQWVNDVLENNIN